jgi:hypothetical protein
MQPTDSGASGCASGGAGVGGAGDGKDPKKGRREGNLAVGGRNPENTALVEKAIEEALKNPPIKE